MWITIFLSRLKKILKSQTVGKCPWQYCGRISEVENVVSRIYREEPQKLRETLRKISIWRTTNSFDVHGTHITKSQPDPSAPRQWLLYVPESNLFVFVPNLDCNSKLLLTSIKQARYCNYLSLFYFSFIHLFSIRNMGRICNHRQCTKRVLL